MPSLSVVIPSHNRPDLLRPCLASVARYAPPGTEVIVVDDASPGGSVSRAAATFGFVRVVPLPRRGGFCVAANAGVRAAAGAAVELLNDDTEVTAGRVDSAGDRYFVGGIAGKRSRGRPLGPEHLVPGPVFGASASSAFYRRDAFLAAGGFPESFGAYFEDVDLSFRLHRAGWQILYEPAARVLHHVSSSYGPPRRELLAQQSRNEERVFWRNLPRGVLLRALPVHLAVVAAKAWRRWREGSLLPFLRGRVSVLGEIGALCRSRRGLGRPGHARLTATWGVEGRFGDLVGL